MREDELKTDLARLRQQVRQIEAEMTSLRNESRRFRHVGFGQDIKDIQLMALEEERALCLSQMSAIERRLGRTRQSKRTALDWLVIPVALAMLGVQALYPARNRGSSRRAHPRRDPLKVAPIPKVDLTVPDYTR